VLPRHDLPLEIMTSNSVTPETVTASAKPESFRSHLPAIAAAAAGTVLATVLGSLIGVAGTLVGIVIGSLLSGTISWWAERGLRRSAAVAAARAEAIKARGRPLHPDEDAAVAQAAVVAQAAAVAEDAEDAVVAEDAQDAAASPSRSRRRRRWAGPAAFVVAAFIGCAVPLTLLEHAVGKPLSAVVQGQPGNGTTLLGRVSGARASHSPSPSATTTGTATAPASSTATGSASSSPAVSATTPAATASGSTTPSATPTAAASASPSPG
jgi:hypothetical protein